MGLYRLRNNIQRGCLWKEQNGHISIDCCVIPYDVGTTYGITQQSIEISAPSELIKMFNLSSNTNSSLTENILQQVKTEEAGKELNFDIELINNKDTDINNVKIIGKLPTTGNIISGQDENTLETIIKGIKAQNATIYYTENASATENIEDATYSL